MKILRKLTWPKLTVLLLLVAATGGGLALSASPQAWQKLTRRSGRNTPVDSTHPESEQQDTAESMRQIEMGNRLLRQARLQLSQQPYGWSASLLQIIQTPEETFRGTGRYVHGASGKSRLEVEMNVSGITGKLLQVSNGQVIWQIEENHVLADEEAEAKVSDKESANNGLKVQRVDLQRILQFAHNAGIDVDRPEIARETQGGLPGLLAALEAEMDFRLIRKVSRQQETFLLLEGAQKPAFKQRQNENHKVARVVKQNAPDRVRLYLREDNLLPIRYICLKKKPGQEGWYAPLALELSEIVQNTVIDSSLFNYRAPDAHVPNDVTHEYLRRLEASLAVDRLATEEQIQK